jgi:aryl-alcohol dehydrogenase-like predicted oxidoreductase
VHTCPVCGFPELALPAWDHGVGSGEVCPSCGTRFGVDDAGDGSIEAREVVHEAMRLAWIADGMQWHSTRAKPEGWDAVRQVDALRSAQPEGMALLDLGRTGLRVTPIGLGMASIGRPAYINIGHGDDLGPDRSVAAVQANAVDVLDTAWEHGVRHVDAARSYGRAEEFLAHWMEARELGRDDLIVSSKWGYEYTADWQVAPEGPHETKEHSVGHLRHQWEESERLLGDRLALYQIHSATFDSGVLDDRQVHDELAAIRERGVVIGVTFSGVAQKDLIRRSMEIEYDGRFLFETVQATWNLLETSAEEALAEAAYEGIGVIVKEALANGRLTERNRLDGDEELVEALGDAADALGVGLDAAALAAALAQPWSHVVLSGAATPDQLKSNLQAVRADWTDRDAKPFENFLEEPKDYWRTRSFLPWT